jgi:hypothetical protein
MLHKIARIPQHLRFCRDVYKQRGRVREFLGFLDCTSQERIGSIFPNESDFLRRLVVEAGSFPGPIIELGTLFGFATNVIADAKRPAQQLVTVDNFCWNPLGFTPYHHREFTRHSLHYVLRNCNTELFVGDCQQFWEQYAGPPPALVFIDANHEYEFVKKDIERAVEKGARIVAGHDYTATWPSVQRAVTESFGEDFEVVESLWAHRMA